MNQPSDIDPIVTQIDDTLTAHQAGGVYWTVPDLVDSDHYGH